MKIASVAEVKAKLSGYLKESREGPVIVTRNGKPAAVLLSVEDEEELERLIVAYSPRFQKILKDARRGIRETGGVRHRDFWEEMEREIPTRRKKK